ncbi:MAG: hypothetical protein QXW30_08010 [Saccharolobus sp.]
MLVSFNELDKRLNALNVNPDLENGFSRRICIRIGRESRGKTGENKIIYLLIFTIYSEELTLSLIYLLILVLNFLAIKLIY